MYRPLNSALQTYRPPASMKSSSTDSAPEWSGSDSESDSSHSTTYYSDLGSQKSLALRRTEHVGELIDRPPNPKLSRKPDKTAAKPFRPPLRTTTYRDALSPLPALKLSKGFRGRTSGRPQGNASPAKYNMSDDEKVSAISVSRCDTSDLDELQANRSASLVPTCRSKTADSSPVLSPQLMEAIELTLSAYKSICNDAQTEAADPLCNPFSSFSPHELEQRYNAVTDAKNAVTLRRSALLADIGDCLLQLDSKLRLYDTDTVFVKSAFHEIQMIKQQSSAIGHRIGFSGLQLFRPLSYKAKFGQSFYEKNRQLCSSVQHVLGVKEVAIQVAYQFLSDPSCLIEHRILCFAAITSP